MAQHGYSSSTTDPRAPTQAQWDAMSDAERRAAVDSLPSEFPRETMSEGDLHRIPKVRAMEALREWYRLKKRNIYLSAELAVYYPGEGKFAPDVIAVLDVDPHLRDRWVVSDEKRGLDFALEVLVSGDARKDKESNVEKYARLGIPEYFIYEPRRARLTGYRLSDGKPGVYTPVVPQMGRWASAVLGLELGVEDGRLRFFSGTASLPDAEELISKLGNMVDSLSTREAILAHELEAERARAEAAAEEREKLARKLRELGVDPDTL